MKKLLVVVVLSLVLIMVLGGVASANGGPHGGYTPTTDACAGCHRAHTAIGSKLLVQSTVYALCIACHGSAGLGANTNVEDGRYLSSRDNAPGGADGNVGAANTPDNALLLGGGFNYYSGTLVTSSHSPSGTTALAWGFGVNRGVTAALSTTLTCTGCHDPHGNGVYRMIRPLLYTTTVTAALVDEGALKDYDTEQWGAGMSTICRGCHVAYHLTAAGAGSNAANVATGGYGHRIDVSWNGDAGTDPLIGMGIVNPETVGVGGYKLPLANTSGTITSTNNLLVCMTCHFPHGTSAAMTGFSAPTFDPTGPLGPIPSGDSSLLRLDNRGVCQVCHQK